MRAIVSTIGRFHSLDLARQLHTRGALAGVFTAYPRFKLRDSGLPDGLIHTWPWLQAPYMALFNRPWFQRRLERRWARWAAHDFDRHVARALPDCDIVSILSGFGGRTGVTARRRGIRVVCDRGSSHILTQETLLREEHERVGVPWSGLDPDVVDRELREYEAADAITVPSEFVRRSFVDRGVPADRLIKAPYGVDLTRFRPAAPREPLFRVLFVGSLSIRKGLHDLLDAYERADLAGAQLALVGGPTTATDAILARHPKVAARLERLGHLPSDRVAHEMSRASVMVLPSIEEGLALVMAQALACGCPVIASTHTGAEDLFQDGREGFIVPPRAPEVIADRLARLHDDPALRDAMSAAAMRRAASIGGWDDYGTRIHAAFAALIARPARSGQDG